MRNAHDPPSCLSTFTVSAKPCPKGEGLHGSDNIDGFMQQLTERFQTLASEARPKEWC